MRTRTTGTPLAARTLTGILALALATSACVIRTGGPANATYTPPPPRSPSPPPPSPTPAPAPAPAPTPSPAPQVYAPGPPSAAQRPPTMAQGSPVLVPGSRIPSVPAPKVSRPIKFGGPDERGALRGLVFFIPEGTQRFPDVSTMAPRAVVYTNELNIPLSNFDEGFPGVADRSEWFAIRYEGTFHVSRPGNWTFKIVSDDGALVDIDGRRVLDNDGVHTPLAKTATVSLAAGVHTLRVDYFQALRWAVQLQLWVAGPGDQEMRLWGPSL